MTIDQETKDYINKIMTEHSIKISAFLSSLCNMLEEKKVLTKEDFEVILERAKNMATQAHMMGTGNFAAFAKTIQEIEKLAKKLEKESIEEGRKNWEDLK